MRMNTLFEMNLEVGHHGECDRCHRETTIVSDPDTAGQGDFELCFDCIKKEFSKLDARKDNHANRS